MRNPMAPLFTTPLHEPAWRPLRIAVIGGRGVPSNYSGVERICEELFAWFADHGHHPTVYCRPSVLDEKVVKYRGMRLVRTPAPGGKNGETLTHSMTSLLHAVSRGDEGRPFDLISMHTIAPNLFSWIATAAGVPLVSHVHGLDQFRQKWSGLGSRVITMAEKVMVRTAAKLVAVNPAIRDHYRDVYGLDAALLPNGVNRTADRPADPQVLANMGLQPGEYVVSVGRLVPEKCLHDTIAAFANVPTDKKLVFVGDAKHTPDYLDSLKAQAKNDPRVIFTGLRQGEELEALFRGAACYVSASELEGNPLSVLECIEYGTCAILSDITGHQPLFEPVDGYNLAFKPGDVAALTDRIRRVLDNPAAAAVQADGCRQHIRRHYAWPKMAELTEKLYLDIIGRHAKPHTHAAAA